MRSHNRTGRQFISYQAISLGCWETLSLIGHVKQNNAAKQKVSEELYLFEHERRVKEQFFER